VLREQRPGHGDQAAVVLVELDEPVVAAIEDGRPREEVRDLDGRGVGVVLPDDGRLSGGGGLRGDAVGGSLPGNQSEGV
jgi:hypothetical protein